MSRLKLFLDYDGLYVRPLIDGSVCVSRTSAGWCVSMSSKTDNMHTSYHRTLCSAVRTARQKIKKWVCDRCGLALARNADTCCSKCARLSLDDHQVGSMHFNDKWELHSHEGEPSFVCDDGVDYYHHCGSLVFAARGGRLYV